MNRPRIKSSFPNPIVKLKKLRIYSKLLAAPLTSCLLMACGDGGFAFRTNQVSDPTTLEVVSASGSDRTVKNSPSTGGLPTGRLTLTDPEYQRFFGPGLEAAFTSLTSFSGIGNIGGFEYRISQRLRVPPGVSGTVKSVRYYSPSGVGYALGTGGTMRFQVLPDDGSAAHMPAFGAAPRAQGDFSPQSAGMVNGVYPLNTDQFQTVLLNAAPKIPIVAGELIHVYTRETTLSPTGWSGVNVRAHTESQKSPNRWLNFADAGVQIFYGAPGFAAPGTAIETTLTPYTPNLPDGGYRTYPIIQIELDNGQLFGTADMETYSYGTNNITLPPGGKLVERFNLNRSRIVDYLSLRFAAKTNGTLAWRIRGINGGAVVTSGTLNVAANFSQINTFGDGWLTDVLSWVDIPLSPTVSLAKGLPFDVELEALSGTFVFAGTVNGSEYGYRTPAAYTESSGFRWDGSAYVKLFPSPIGSTAACCNLDVMFRSAAVLQMSTSSTAPGAIHITVESGPAGARDWVGVYPIGADSTTYPVRWALLDGTTSSNNLFLSGGSLNFVGVEPGSYDVRFFQDWSYTLLASTIVTVPNQSQIVATSPSTNSLSVVVTNGPAGARDWVGIFPTGAASTSSPTRWALLDGTTSSTNLFLSSGVLNFSGPLTPGTYDVRLFHNYGFTLLAATTVVVPVPQLTVTTPTRSSLQVSVQNGPAGARDWVGVFPTGVASTTHPLRWALLDGSTSSNNLFLSGGSLTFIGLLPATYDVRFFYDWGYTLLTSVSVNLPNQAQITATSPTPGTLTINVSNGPAGARDWVGIYPAGAASTTYPTRWALLDGSTSSTNLFLSGGVLNFSNIAPGSYDVRFFFDWSYNQMANTTILIP